jgi:hypothetical protein
MKTIADGLAALSRSLKRVRFKPLSRVYWSRSGSTAPPVGNAVSHTIRHPGTLKQLVPGTVQIARDLPVCLYIDLRR